MGQAMDSWAVDQGPSNYLYCICREMRALL